MDDPIARLERLLASNRAGLIEINYDKHLKVPYTCNFELRSGEFGSGTGRSIIEAIEDALFDYEEHAL